LWNIQTPWTRVLFKKLVGPQSRHSLHIMEPKVSLLYAEKLTTGPYLEPMDPVHALRSRFFKNHCNMFPSMPSCTSGLFPSGFPTRILYAFLFSSIHATCLGHLILFLFFFNHPSNIWWGIETSRSSICNLLWPLVASSFS